jgi:hypothetical protein
MAKQHLFVFVDCDPRELPDALTKRLARAGALAVMGPSEKDTFDTNIFYDYRDDDNASVRSTDSVEDEDDNRTTRLLGTLQNGLELIIIEEREEWKLEFMPIELPSSD